MSVCMSGPLIVSGGSDGKVLLWESLNWQRRAPDDRPVTPSFSELNDVSACSHCAAKVLH